MVMEKNKAKFFIKADLQILIRGMTSKPGVYRMLDGAGKVLYIGKAKELKKRVSSYFTRADSSLKTRAMVAQIRDIEVTVTHTEKEALILENNQIKQFKPRYNIWFRDSKSYPYIYLATTHETPGFGYHRGAKRKAGRYFGPYPSAGAVREILNVMKKLFKVRQCKDSFFAHRTRPCLEYQIKRCSAPCTGYISQENYRQDVEHSVMFLQGQSKQVLDGLIKPMQKAADELRYEHAAHYRDQISSLRKLQESQYITTEKGDIDVVATSVSAGVPCVQVFFIRNGLNLGGQTYFPKNYLSATDFSIPGLAEVVVIERFLAQFYLQDGISTGLPQEILLSHVPQNHSPLQEAISAHAKRQIKIKYRLRGNRAKWIKMAQENVQLALLQHLHKKENQQQRLDSLQQLLGLDVSPQYMECFDVSHTGGVATVAACVVFDNGQPSKTNYRRFNIDGIQHGDDYAAMQESMRRRYVRVQQEGGRTPDVIFVDGGKGQVNMARQVLEEIQLNTPVLIGIAKGPSRKPGQETLVIDHGRKKIHLSDDSPALHLIQHIRDEAHRFALGGHRKRRKKVLQQSPLEDIDGIGGKRRQSLLRHFGGMQGIMSAGIDDLSRANGISKNLAHRIYDAFHASL